MRVHPGNPIIEHRLRAVACCAVVIALTLGALAPRAHAGAPLLVRPPGDRSGQELDLARLGPPDVNARPYRIREEPGAGTRSKTVTGVSLALVLQAARIEPASFTLAEVLRPDGTSLLLTNAQIYRPAPSLDGPPVLSDQNGNAFFMRAITGPSDVNADDAFAVTNQIFTIHLHTGSQLAVSTQAHPESVPIKTPVRFRSKVSGAKPGETFTYQWHFGDGTDQWHSDTGAGATTPTATHQFTVDGPYVVSLRVIGSKGSIGVSTTPVLKVGTPSKGPRRRGGGKNPNKNAPTHGAGTGTGGDGRGGTGTGGNGPSGAAGTVGSNAARPSAAALHRRHTPTRLSARARHKPIEAPKPAPSSRRRISGSLVSDAPVPTRSAPPATSAGGSAAARTGRVKPPSPSGAIPTWVWAALVVAGLMGLGGWLESGGTRRIVGALAAVRSRRGFQRARSTA